MSLQQNADHIRATLTIDPSESDPLTAAATQSITDELQSQNDLETLTSTISGAQIVKADPDNQGLLFFYLSHQGITQNIPYNKI